MLFNSLFYVVFLAVVVAISWGLARWRWGRTVFLLACSCLFYMAWSPQYILLILGAATWDWAMARVIEKTPDSKAGLRKALMLGSVAVNLGLLGYYKYLGFFVENLVAVLHAAGLDVAIGVAKVALPVGISFFTFQSMAYVVDVYRREMPAERNLLRFWLFATFFPQLVAGPISRAHILIPQLHRPPRLQEDDVGEALFRIATGLVKKVVVADWLALNLVDRVFSNPGIYSGAEILVGLYAYTLQIYCDFSGYTDIAVGSARLLGIKLPENFNRPYRARTVAEFWRRWHITLSTWLRHYVFFPLGGSRGSMGRANRNTLITLVLIGLWHGANWTFVLYGLLHGVAIAWNRVQTRKQPKGWSHDELPWTQNLWRIALTFHFVVLARILFRAPSLAAAGDLSHALLHNGLGLARIDSGTWLVLALGYAAHWAPPGWADRLRLAFRSWPVPAQGAALVAVASLMGLVAETDAVPFIYFQF
ncbi:MAG: MBOAT family protein [Deltaproteobacteria bacterium]|nr:MBOAT family protein [Deltaproteobacteria bacterium]